MPAKDVAAADKDVDIESEYKIKAAFLVNFVKYITFSSAKLTELDEIVIGVLGMDPFGSFIDTAVEKITVNGKKIKIRRFLNYKNIDQIHILWVSKSNHLQLNEINRFIESFQILTVSDLASYCERGGMVGLVNIEGKIRFIINEANIKKSGLRVSSRLLRLAEKIIE